MNPRFELSYDFSKIRETANDLVVRFGNHKIWTFTGGLGAGKTTLINHIVQSMGSIDIVSSPTFSLVNEYRISEDKLLYHMDLYRLDSIDEALNIDIEGYLFSGQYCFIEWPALITPLFDDDVLEIDIQIIDELTRKIIIL